MFSPDADAAECLHFVTVRDVAPLLDGCAEWFANPDAFHDACRVVWSAAEHDGRGARIDRERASGLMWDAARHDGED